LSYIFSRPLSLPISLSILTSSLSSDEISTRVSGRRSMCRGERKEGGPKKKRGSEEKEKRRKSQNQKRKSIAVTMRSQSLLLALRSASSLTASASSLSSSSACASAAAAALSGFRRYHKNVRREFARASEGLGICSRFFFFCAFRLSCIHEPTRALFRFRLDGSRLRRLVYALRATNATRECSVGERQARFDER